MVISNIQHPLAHFYPRRQPYIPTDYGGHFLSDLTSSNLVAPLGSFAFPLCGLLRYAALGILIKSNQILTLQGANKIRNTASESKDDTWTHSADNKEPDLNKTIPLICSVSAPSGAAPILQYVFRSTEHIQTILLSGCGWSTDCGVDEQPLGNAKKQANLALCRKVDPMQFRLLWEDECLWRFKTQKIGSPYSLRAASAAGFDRSLGKWLAVYS